MSAQPAFTVPWLETVIGEFAYSTSLIDHSELAPVTLEVPLAANTVVESIRPPLSIRKVASPFASKVLPVPRKSEPELKYELAPVTSNVAVSNPGETSVSL